MTLFSFIVECKPRNAIYGLDVHDQIEVQNGIENVCDVQHDELHQKCMSLDNRNLPQVHANAALIKTHGNIPVTLYTH